LQNSDSSNVSVIAKLYRALSPEKHPNAISVLVPCERNTGVPRRGGELESSNPLH